MHHLDKSILYVMHMPKYMQSSKLLPQYYTNSISNLSFSLYHSNIVCRLRFFLLFPSPFVLTTQNLPSSYHVYKLLPFIIHFTNILYLHFDVCMVSVSDLNISARKYLYVDSLFRFVLFCCTLGLPVYHITFHCSCIPHVDVVFHFLSIFQNLQS